MLRSDVTEFRKAVSSQSAVRARLGANIVVEPKAGAWVNVELSQDQHTIALKPELKEWLKDSANGNGSLKEITLFVQTGWYHEGATRLSFRYMAFRDANTALLFKMRWGGEQ